MLKHLIHKLLGSLSHSKHRHHRYSSDAPMHHYGRRHSSDRGYGHNRHGHGYYKNKYKSSS